MKKSSLISTLLSVIPVHFAISTHFVIPAKAGTQSYNAKLKSSHLGFISSISLNFQRRFHFLSCFSLFMAASAESALS